MVEVTPALAIHAGCKRGHVLAGRVMGGGQGVGRQMGTQTKQDSTSRR